MKQQQDTSVQAQLFASQESAERARRAREMLVTVRNEILMSTKNKEKTRREHLQAVDQFISPMDGGPDDPRLKSAAERVQALEQARRLNQTNRNLTNAFVPSRKETVVARPKAPAAKVVDTYVAPERPLNEIGTLKGVVKRIIFSNPVDDFYIAEVRPVGASTNAHNVTVTGNGPEIQAGMEVEAKGVWGARNGVTQLQSAIINESFPMTIEGIRALMNSGFVKGIGPETTENLLTKFGTKLFDIVEFEPDRLKDVQGMGDKRRDAFVEAIHEKKASVRIFAFLAEGGLSPSASMKVFKEYKEATIDMVKEDPYRITRIEGIGFKTADAMAMKYGMSSTSGNRVIAAMEEVVRTETNEGSTAIPKAMLCNKIIDLIGGTAKSKDGTEFVIDNEFIQPLVEATLAHTEYLTQRALMIRNEQGRYELTDCVSLTRMCRAERYIAQRITSMASESSSRLMSRVDLSAPHFSKLDNSQLEAARTSLTSPVSIITGRPGCGKTTVTKSIIQEFENKGLKVLLMAPTGKAANRMKEATGRNAFTIHSALGYDGENYNKKASDPLEADVVIVDEASMIDTQLMANLLAAVARGTQLIMVGDIDQLPSVGAGRVLCDIIDSKVMPVSRLSKIHRQAAGSAIITNAHLIINGEMPEDNPIKVDVKLGKTVPSDFKMVHCANDNKTAPNREDQEDAVIDTFMGMLKEGFNPEDIQILTPMKRYGMGVNSLNKRIKELLNPTSRLDKDQTLEKLSSEGGKLQISVGDRVMQTANNKEIGVSNGELGYIKAFDHETKKMIITFGEAGDKEVPMSGLSSLDLAYAKTIHKSQGSEYPAVIMPLVTGHWKMLNRNLVYTGLTRGKKRVAMVGDLKAALKKAVTTDGIDYRITGLQDEIECRLPEPALKAQGARM